jgi:hypothetical protein
MKRGDYFKQSMHKKCIRRGEEYESEQTHSSTCALVMQSSCITIDFFCVLKNSCEILQIIYQMQSDKDIYSKLKNKMFKM